MVGGMDDPFPNIDLSVLTPRQREVVEMHYACRLTSGRSPCSSASAGRQPNSATSAPSDACFTP